MCNIFNQIGDYVIDIIVLEKKSFLSILWNAFENLMIVTLTNYDHSGICTASYDFFIQNFEYHI